MINATLTIQITSIRTSFDSNGIKMVFGDCLFQHYSKDGVTEEIISYRAKGSAALEITEKQTAGVAIGYLDLKTVDNGTYKSKEACLVIRTFIPTTVVNSEPDISSQEQEFQIPTQQFQIPLQQQPQAATQQPQAQKNQQMVKAGTNGKGRLSNRDDIPF